MCSSLGDWSPVKTLLLSQLQLTHCSLMAVGFLLGRHCSPDWMPKAPAFLHPQICSVTEPNTVTPRMNGPAGASSFSDSLLKADCPHKHPGNCHPQTPKGQNDPIHETSLKEMDTLSHTCSWPRSTTLIMWRHTLQLDSWLPPLLLLSIWD